MGLLLDKPIEYCGIYYLDIFGGYRRVSEGNWSVPGRKLYIKIKMRKDDVGIMIRDDGVREYYWTGGVIYEKSEMYFGIDKGRRDIVLTLLHENAPIRTIKIRIGD